MITFAIEAQTALWRDPLESGTTLSSPGPSPSAIAGLLGCVLGFPACNERQKAPPHWRDSPGMLAWLEESNCRVACAWAGKQFQIKRFSHGLKLQKDHFNEGPLIEEAVLIWMPRYLIAVEVDDGEDALFQSLANPRWRPFLGTRSSPAWISNITRGGVAARWATVVERANEGLEVTAIGRHVVNDVETGERIQMSSQFWDYMPQGEAHLPTPDEFLRTWVRLPAPIKTPPVPKEARAKRRIFVPSKGVAK